MASPGQQSLDQAIITAARELYIASLMDEIRKAHQNGVPATVRIGQYLIQYEPRPFSGMTMFGLKGFVIGQEAFASESEFKKTLLHELYRLHHSELAKGGGVDKNIAKAESQAAFQFAERYHTQL